MAGVLALTDQRNAGPPAWLAGPLVGGLVVAIGVAFGFNAGYAINPARDFGPRLFTAVAGWGGAVFTAGGGWWWVPIVGPHDRRGGRGGALRPVRRALPAGGRSAAMSRYVLALDQGTTSSRSIVFDRNGRVVAQAQQEFPQMLPGPGQVEHDPEAIWSSQLQTARDALTGARIPATDLAAIGVTNQRETTDPVGEGHRQARRQRDRLAEPRDRADLRSA